MLSRFFFATVGDIVSYINIFFIKLIFLALQILFILFIRTVLCNQNKCKPTKVFNQVTNSTPAILADKNAGGSHFYGEIRQRFPDGKK